MFDFIAKGLTKVFGTKSDRDIKEVLPKVEQINKEFAKLANLSHDELRAKTTQISERINAYLKDIDDQIATLHKKVEDDADMDLHEKEAVFNEIDSLEEQRNVKLEEVLLEVLPETFAIVKDTARRFMENKQLEVTATMYDKQLAGKYEHINLNGDKAIWNNSWKAAGTEVTWNMMHYDVQLIGGMVLHNGKIAEMATGEGKTLVATLPAFLNALAKRGVHIVTVNDYLAKRDAEWMAPIYQFHGISCSCIDNFRPNSPERREAYQSDIVYGTNNEFGFDYLRDNMTRETKELVQGKHHFAMIDEVDSVLIDEARTPLIISGPVPKGDVHEFQDLKPRVEKLVAEQRKIVSQYLLDAKRLIKEGNDKEGGLALFRAYRGFPKHKPLIKFLSETGVRQVLQKTENIYLADNSKLMPEADEPLFFVIEEKNNNIDLTEKGIDLITKDGEDESFFILPDIGVEIAKIENDSDLSDQEILKKKDEIIKDYAVKAERIHTINQLLKAYSLFEKDTDETVKRIYFERKKIYNNADHRIKCDYLKS